MKKKIKKKKNKQKKNIKKKKKIPGFFFSEISSNTIHRRVSICWTNLSRLQVYQCQTSLLLYLRFSGENARRTARFKCSNARVGNQDVTDKRGQNTIVRIEQRNGRFPRKKTFLFQMK